MLTLNQASAQAIVRDDETERTIRTYATPIFEAAGLVPEDVKLYLVNDKTLNASVAGGQNIFINLGLLMQADSYAQVLGVIAHETGHILGGHLARTREALGDADVVSTLTAIIGIGAGLLTGSGDLVAATVASGRQVAQKGFLSFSRTQEASADQAALRLMEKTGTSAKGLADFFALIEDQELPGTPDQDPYARTHPLSRERIEAIQAHLATSRYSDVPPDPGFEQSHRRIQAKIFAFTNPLQTVLNRYPPSDTSIEARYARTFAYYKQTNFAKAIAGIDALIAEFPDDPYFHELRGQILFKNGNVVRATESFHTAVSLIPESALLRTMLAQALVAINQPATLAEAETQLKASLAIESNAPFAWRQLAIAYGRQDKKGESALALAEEAILRKQFGDALFQARKAEGMFAEGSRGWLQAQDIIRTAQPEQGR